KGGGSGPAMSSGYAIVTAAAALAFLVYRTRAGMRLPGALSFGSPRGFAVLIFGLALSLRLLVLIALPIEPTGDPASHERAAWSVAQGHGYVRDGHPDPHYPPGYVLFASVFYFLAGREWEVLAAVNCLVDAGTALLVYRVAETVWSPRGGRLAALLYALNPAMLINAQVIMYGPLLGLLLVTLVLVHRRPVLFGLAAGVAALVKPIVLPVPILACWVHAIAKRRPVDILRQAAISVVVMMVVISPWTLRNYVEFDRLLLISANGGWVLWWGNNDASEGLMMPWNDEQKATRGPAVIDLDKRMGREALDWIAENPLRFLALIPKKQAHTWGTEAASLPDLAGLGATGELLARSLVQFYYIFLAINVSYICIVRSHTICATQEGQMIVILLLLLLGIHSVYIGWAFYHQSFLPLMSVVAAGGMGLIERRAAATNAALAGSGGR
ncbi:MAG: hypothetical protein AB7K86_16445, partial [Rhodospirillales bacterium]